MLVSTNNKKELTLSSAKKAKTLSFKKINDTIILKLSNSNRHIIGLINQDYIVLRNGIKVSKKLYNDLNEIKKEHFKDITNEIKKEINETNKDLLSSLDNECNKKELKRIATIEHKLSHIESFREILLQSTREIKKVQLLAGTKKDNSYIIDISLSSLSHTILDNIDNSLVNDYKNLIIALQSNIIPKTMRLDLSNIDSNIVTYKTMTNETLNDILSHINIIAYILDNSSKKQAKKVSNMSLNDAKKAKKILADKLDLEKQMSKLITNGMSISQDIKKPLNNVA